jgi:hypothetical protein
MREQASLKNLSGVKSMVTKEILIVQNLSGQP